jgi:NAD(P)-dependent dehydrogenase (short-subunit alcohol dehydrogenase family)
MPMHLPGSRIVVTGAAGGIGRALAAAFVDAGALVVVNDIDGDGCLRAAEDLGCHAAPGDAASTEGVRQLIATARGLVGEIDLFCANAGIELGGSDSDEAWQRTWDVNVMAHVRAFRELAPRWLEQGEGRFLATVSAAGLLMMPGAAAYTATKHAALAYAEWLAVTYGDKGITVQALCPMGVRTAMARTDTAAGAVVLGPTLIETGQVVDQVLAALADDRFLILPHPEVADFEQHKAADRQRWLAGMQRVQQAIEEYPGR